MANIIIKCKHGECKHFVNGKCKKQKEIAKLPMEELAKTIVTNICPFRE